MTYTAILKCLFVYVLFIKEIDSFIQQICIQLIKSDSKDVNIKKKSNRKNTFY